MIAFEEKSYPVFDLFHNQWGLVTAGNPERFNGCTVSWGSLETLWERPGHEGHIVTVYLHPARYTCEFMKNSDLFTLCFFPKEQKKALAYLGSHSGRDGDKIEASGLTPVPMGDCVGYREAKLSFLCRKLYQHEFSKEDLAEEISTYYMGRPSAFPPDDKGDWHPHCVFVGEILEVEEK